MPRKDKQIL